MTKHFMMQIGFELLLIIPAMIASTPFLEELSLYSENWKYFWWISAHSMESSLFPHISIQCCLGKNKAMKMRSRKMLHTLDGCKCPILLMVSYNHSSFISIHCHMFILRSVCQSLGLQTGFAPLCILVMTNNWSELLHYKPTVISTPWLFHHIWL